MHHPYRLGLGALGVFVLGLLLGWGLLGQSPHLASDGEGVCETQGGHPSTACQPGDWIELVPARVSWYCDLTRPTFQVNPNGRILCQYVGYGRPVREAPAPSPRQSTAAEVQKRKDYEREMAQLCPTVLAKRPEGRLPPANSTYKQRAGEELDRWMCEVWQSSVRDKPLHDERP